MPLHRIISVLVFIIPQDSSSAAQQGQDVSCSGSVKQTSLCLASAVVRVSLVAVRHLSVALSETPCVGHGAGLVLGT